MDSSDVKKMEELAEKAKEKLKKELPNEDRQKKIIQELTDFNKIAEETKHFLVNVLDGVFTCIQGVKAAVLCPKVQAKHKKYAKFFLGACVGIFILTQILVLPFRIILGLIGLIISLPDSAFGWMDTLVNGATFFLPFVAVMVIRNINPKPLESMFFATLQTLDPAYHDILKATPKWSDKEGRDRARGNLWRSLKLALVFKALSMIPYVNIISVPLAEYIALNRKFGIKQSVIFIVAMVAGFRTQVVYFMSMWISSRLLSRELLDPFLSRKQLPEGTQRQFLKKYDPLIIGFAFPLMLAVDLPYIGCMFFGLSFAAAAALSLKIRDKAPSIGSGLSVPASTPTQAGVETATKTVKAN